MVHVDPILGLNIWYCVQSVVDVIGLGVPFQLPASIVMIMDILKNWFVLVPSITFSMFAFLINVLFEQSGLL